MYSSMSLFNNEKFNHNYSRGAFIPWRTECPIAPTSASETSGRGTPLPSPRFPVFPDLLDNKHYDLDR